MKTFAQRLALGLFNLGWLEDNHATTSKYRVFIKYDDTGKVCSRLYIGGRGALRSGRTVASSHSIGDPANQTKAYSSILQAANLGNTNL